MQAEIERLKETNQEMLARWDKEDAEILRKAIAAEREACAKVADEYGAARVHSYQDFLVAKEIAAAIRARKDEQGG